MQNFLLCLEKYGRKSVYLYFDFYRLSSAEDAETLGLADYFGGDNISIVEWGENVKEIIPENAKTVNIEKTGETERKIIL